MQSFSSKDHNQRDRTSNLRKN